MKVDAAGSNKLFRKVLAVDPADLGCEAEWPVVNWVWATLEGGFEMGIALGAER